MENKEMNLIYEEEIEKPKFHYETVSEVTKEVPVYDKDGNQTRTETRVKGRIFKKVWTDEDVLKKRKDAETARTLKAELAKIKEDIEQEVFGLVRDDFAVKKGRAAEIINELRVLEGKEPRAVKGDIINENYND